MGKYLSKNEITEKIKQQICNDYLSGMQLKMIANKYNIADAMLIARLKEWSIFKPKNNRWTIEEIELLKEIYPKIRSWNEILCKFPRHKKQGIMDKASALKIRKDVFFWSLIEEQILLEEYNKGKSILELAQILNNRFSIGAIETKLIKLGISRTKAWSQEDLEYLIKNYHIKDLDEIEHRLYPRGRKNIINKASDLGLVAKMYYTKEEEDFIQQNYKFLTDKQMTKYINKSRRSITDKRISMNLMKDFKKGMYESVDNYLRKQIKPWKKESLKACEYKCILTGNRLDAIHHLYGMNLIIDETFKELQIDIREKFEDYTEAEIEIIKNKFLEVHSKYPLGVCLTKEVHDLFHTNYGFGNNTPEQFEEFKQRFYTGEFDDIINII